MNLRRVLHLVVCPKPRNFQVVCPKLGRRRRRERVRLRRACHGSVSTRSWTSLVSDTRSRSSAHRNLLVPLPELRSGRTGSGVSTRCTRNIMLLKAVGKVPTTCGLSRAAALPSRTKPSVMRDLLARWCTLNAGAQHSRAHSALLLDDCCRR